MVAPGVETYAEPRRRLPDRPQKQAMYPMPSGAPLDGSRDVTLAICLRTTSTPKARADGTAPTAPVGRRRLAFLSTMSKNLPPRFRRRYRNKIRTSLANVKVSVGSTRYVRFLNRSNGSRGDEADACTDAHRTDIAMVAPPSSAAPLPLEVLVLFQLLSVFLEKAP
jgi:hypothetical protein